MFLLYDLWKLLAKYQPFKYFDIIFHKWFEETKQYIDAIKEAETREEKVDLFLDYYDYMALETQCCYGYFCHSNSSNVGV